MIIDKIGNRSLIQFIASSNVPLIFILMSNSTISPTWGLVWMGLVYSITESNGFALVSMIVPTEVQGSAFGLIGCSISFALLIEPAFVGLLREKSGGFDSSIWVFVVLTSLGAAASLLVYVYDLCNDNLTTRCLPFSRS